MSDPLEVLRETIVKAQGCVEQWTIRDWEQQDAALAQVATELTELRAERDTLAESVRLLSKEIGDSNRERDRLAEMLADDEAVMAGVRAVRHMLQMRVGDRHAHAEAFRAALDGLEARDD